MEEHQKLTLREAVVVEGRYDAARLANLVEATILTTDGFAVFTDKKRQNLLKTLAKTTGLILLTDSDAAGFQIRHYITGLVGAERVKQAYVPAIHGKEPRKAAPGKEGLLGVEGVADELLLRAIETALAGQKQPEPTTPVRPITYTDLYEWGISGTPGSSAARRVLLERLDLPPRLSKKGLLQVLNTLYTYESLDALIREVETGKPETGKPEE